MSKPGRPLLSAAQRSAMVRAMWADPVRRAERLAKVRATMAAKGKPRLPQAPSSLEPGDRGVHYPDEAAVKALYKGQRYDGKAR